MTWKPECVSALTTTRSNYCYSKFYLSLFVLCHMNNKFDVAPRRSPCGRTQTYKENVWCFFSKYHWKKKEIKKNVWMLGHVFQLYDFCATLLYITSLFAKCDPFERGTHCDWFKMTQAWKWEITVFVSRRHKLLPQARYDNRK